MQRFKRGNIPPVLIRGSEMGAPEPSARSGIMSNSIRSSRLALSLPMPSHGQTSANEGNQIMSSNHAELSAAETSLRSTRRLIPPLWQQTEAAKAAVTGPRFPGIGSVA
jgi:hypothetical protein